MWVTKFKWDAAKFPSRVALPQLLGVINRALSEIDTAVKKKGAHYNGIRSQLSQFEKRSTASLVTRPLSEVVKASVLFHEIGLYRLISAGRSCTSKRVSRNIIRRASRPVWRRLGQDVRDANGHDRAEIVEENYWRQWLLDILGHCKY